MILWFKKKTIPSIQNAWIRKYFLVYSRNFHIIYKIRLTIILKNLLRYFDYVYFNTLILRLKIITPK